MKIGVPISDQKARPITLSEDFINSGHIGIYDMNTNTMEITPKTIDINNGLSDWLIANKIEAIITPSLSPMALMILKRQSIAVFKAEGKLLSLNLELFRNESLSPLLISEARFQNSSTCDSVCGSCNSSCDK